MPNDVKLCSKHFSRGTKNFPGDFAHPLPPSYGPGPTQVAYLLHPKSPPIKIILRLKTQAAYLRLRAAPTARLIEMGKTRLLPSQNLRYNDTIENILGDRKPYLSFTPWTKFKGAVPQHSLTKFGKWVENGGAQRGCCCKQTHKPRPA